MPKPIIGLHHVTAIASDPQRNLDFYTQVLGFRLVKRTINFDDPGSYHFYFGDDAGSPGTILTFFIWPKASRGTLGPAETSATAFSVPFGSVGFWEQRLRTHGVVIEHLERRFDNQVLAFADPDGTRLEIVGHLNVNLESPSRFADIPTEHSIRGFFGVTLAEQVYKPTAQVLATMGFHKVAEEGNRFRFRAEGSALGSQIDLLIAPKLAGRMGAGSVHHIAFRVADDASQLEWRDLLNSQSFNVTPVQDRTYFHSIYFREPGGVLFEIATDSPGFAFDESIEALGEALKLPQWLEPQRRIIEQRLPSMVLHHSAGAAK